MIHFRAAAFRARGDQCVARAGFRFFELIEQPSEIVLPALLSAGKSYDMALIDGLHTADQTLLDFYYLDRMLRSGGILVIDDVAARAVNKPIRSTDRLLATSGRRRNYASFIKRHKSGCICRTLAGP